MLNPADDFLEHDFAIKYFNNAYLSNEKLNQLGSTSFPRGVERTAVGKDNLSEITHLFLIFILLLNGENL